MTAAATLSCPRCQATLDPQSWPDPGHGACPRCRTEFEFVAFPALTAARAPLAVQAAVLAEDSTCFFHAENRADGICEGCGRLLCAICAVPFAGQKLCPACIAAAKRSPNAATVRDRVLFDSLALTLAALPLLVWPVTLITAPAALGMVIYGWNQPGSLVRGRGRGRFLIAAILALLEIAGWAALLVFWWLKK